MIVTYPCVPFCEFVRPVFRPIAVEAGMSYRTLGVKWWGEGAYERETLDGAAMRSKTLSVVHTGDLIFNKIWVRNGSSGVIRHAMDGCVASGEFSTFELDVDQVDSRWLLYLFKTKWFWEECDRRSQGTSGKNRIRPNEYLQIAIPLPSLPEQQRILACIESLAGRVEEALRLRREAAVEFDALITSLHLQLSGSRVVRLEELLVLHEIRMPVRPDGDYPQVGIRSFGNGLFSKVATTGAETTYKHFNRLYAGAVVLSQVKGWEGAIAVCPTHLAGWYASPEYRTFRCISEMASPEYLAILLATPWFWKRLQDVTRGVGARRERTRPEQFLCMELPMPSLAGQRYAARVFSKHEGLRQLHVETLKVLDALMPSIVAKAFAGEL